MRFPVLLLLPAFILFAACGNKQEQKSEDKVGTANQSITEVIGKDGGFIIENATIAEEGDAGGYTLPNTKVNLMAGTSSVLIINGRGNNEATKTVLALEFPSFAEGTVQEYSGDASSAAFNVYGEVDGANVAQKTGLVSGSVRFVKKSESTVDLGLNRAIMEGVGDIEVVVSGINGGGLSITPEKKFVARFQLPIVTLDEMMKLQTPS